MAVASGLALCTSPDPEGSSVELVVRDELAIRGNFPKGGGAAKDTVAEHSFGTNTRNHLGDFKRSLGSHLDEHTLCRYSSMMEDEASGYFVGPVLPNWRTKDFRHPEPIAQHCR
jgi:hypothetical protein